jgi:predicted small secreted protein
MKIINVVASLLLICSFVVLSGCANTANGMHQDWRDNTQKIANATGN